jgi:hypothetical protein
VTHADWYLAVGTELGTQAAPGVSAPPLPEVSTHEVLEVGARARRLLVAYADTLDLVEQLPPAPMVSTGWCWWRRPDSPIRLPRVSWMLRPLLVWHIDRVLTAAAQLFHRRVALGIAESAEADALDVIEAFRSSLPPRSRALGLGVLAVATVFVAQVLDGLLPQHVATGGRLPVGTQTARLFNASFGTFDPSAHSVASAASYLFKASPAALAAVAGLLALSAYLILRPVSSAFRLKRLLLNLYPDADSLRRTAPASWSVSRSLGVYTLERELFATGGAQPPGEPPLDLIVSLPIPIMLVGAWIGVIAVDNNTSPGGVLLSVVLALAAYGLPGVLRLAWLHAVWRARHGRRRSSWLFAEDIAVPWGNKRLRGHSPLLIGWLSSYGLLVLLVWPVLPWLWWAAARDLRDLGRRHGAKRVSRIHPVIQAFLICPVPVGWLLWFIPLARAPHLIRDAQIAVGMQKPVSRHLAWLTPLYPVLCVLLQRQLNRLWRAEGHLAAVGRPETYGDLPLILGTAPLD